MKIAGVLFLCLIATLFSGRATRAQTHDMHGQMGASSPKPAEKVDENSKPITPPDLALLNQDGDQIHFYSDLVKDKVVVISFIYTSCTTICPVLGGNMARLQNRLGERMGNDVYLISVSVDPEVDTPQRLKSWGARFDAKRGWTLVTGKKADIDRLLKALAGGVVAKEDHGFAILIGNDSKQKWIREYGLANVDELIKRIDDLAK